MSGADYQLGELKTALVKLNEVLDCLWRVDQDKRKMLSHSISVIESERDKLRADIKLLEFWRGEAEEKQ